jgi:transposase
VHLRVEGQGQLMTLVLTPGQRHEITAFERLMQQGAVKRTGPGRPRVYPERLVADKGYSFPAVRRFLRQHHVRLTIPHRRNQHRRGPFDKSTYRLRNIVERLINRLKHYRRLATRYEKCAENYRAMWLIAATIEWLKL